MAAKNRRRGINGHRGSDVIGILLRHGRRIDGTRSLAHCVPTESEIKQGFQSLGATGKVIYDSEVKAARAAAELYEAGQLRQVPYRCLRADGHWHLRTDLGE